MYYYIATHINSIHANNNTQIYTVHIGCTLTLLITKKSGTGYLLCLRLDCSESSTV